MKKKIFFLVIIIIFLIGLLGRCGYKSRWEVMKWFQEERTDAAIKVDWFYEYNEDNYRIWDARLKDLPEVKFHLYATYGYSGMPGALPIYSVTSDYYYVIGQYYLEQYMMEYPYTRELFECGSWNCLYCEMSAMYENREELLYLCEEMDKFDEYQRMQEYPAQMKYSLYVNDVSAEGHLGSSYIGVDDIKDLQEEALKEYACYVAVYRVNVEDFTIEELIEAIERDEYVKPIHLYKPNENGESVEEYYFEDIGYLDPHFTFGALYEVLNRMGGYDLSGNVMSFSFTGADGRRYEFSYDRNVPGVDSNGNPIKGFGYYVEGEAYYTRDCSLSKESLYEITGLQLVD